LVAWPEPVRTTVPPPPLPSSRPLFLPCLPAQHADIIAELRRLPGTPRPKARGEGWIPKKLQQLEDEAQRWFKAEDAKQKPPHNNHDSSEEDKVRWFKALGDKQPTDGEESKYTDDDGKPYIDFHAVDEEM
jgi:hypothetical protein